MRKIVAIEIISYLLVTIFLIRSDGVGAEKWVI
jgi:hypothetical protein